MVFINYIHYLIELQQENNDFTNHLFQFKMGVTEFVDRIISYDKTIFHILQLLKWWLSVHTSRLNILLTGLLRFYFTSQNGGLSVEVTSLQPNQCNGLVIAQKDLLGTWIGQTKYQNNAEIHNFRKNYLEQLK